MAADAPRDFRCRVCGCDRYVQIEVMRNRELVRTPFYRCCGCSAMFHDPLDFSGARELMRREQGHTIGGNIPGSKAMIPPAPNPYAPRSPQPRKWSRDRDSH